MNNFRISQEQDLRNALEELNRRTREKKASENRMIYAGEMLATVDEMKAILEEYHSVCREDFRYRHGKEMDCQQRIGEISDEFFQFAETEEDWH